jgi:CxxC motif-containing protein
MQIERDLICIGCPKGCHVTIVVDDRGSIVSITGYECKAGKEYAEGEYKNPVRVLTGTILTDGSRRRTLPFKTNKPIQKERLMNAMRFFTDLRVRPPTKFGQTIISDILGTGADVICTDELTD